MRRGAEEQCMIGNARRDAGYDLAYLLVVVCHATDAPITVCADEMTILRYMYQRKA